MIKSRLYQLYSNLTKAECRNFGKFLNSPYYNQQESLILLFQYLNDTKWNSKIIPDKASAFKAIFPKGHKYDDNKMRLLMSTLFKLIESFLVIEQFSNDKLKPKIALANIYRSRSMERHFFKTLKELKDIQKKSVIQNADYFYNNLIIDTEEIRFLSSNQRSVEFNLQEVSDNLDTAFIARKLKNACALVSHQTVYKKDYESGFLPQILEFVEKGTFDNIPFIKVYYSCYMFLTSGEERFFEDFKELIVQYGEIFQQDEIRDLYLHGVNYCIKQLNVGKVRFAKEGIELYKVGLEKEFFYVDGMLSRFTYRNISAIGLIMKDFDWVENFIFTYKDKLESKYRESSFNFNLAQLEYSRKNYDKALILLQQYEYKDLLMNLVAKTVQLRVYYELNELKLLDSHLDSMKIFLRRKNILGYHRDHYLKVIHYTRKLLSINPYDKEEKKALLESVQGEKVLIVKDWLIEHIQKL